MIWDTTFEDGIEFPKYRRSGNFVVKIFSYLPATTKI